MDVSTFCTQFPELANAGEPMLQAFLDAADLEIDRKIWGAKADQGQAYLAAHKLTLSPWGQNARLVSTDGKTTYAVHFESLQMQVTSGYRCVLL